MVPKSESLFGQQVRHHLLPPRHPIVTARRTRLAGLSRINDAPQHRIYSPYDPSDSRSSLYTKQSALVDLRNASAGWSRRQRADSPLPTAAQTLRRRRITSATWLSHVHWAVWLCHQIWLTSPSIRNNNVTHQPLPTSCSSKTASIGLR